MMNTPAVTPTPIPILALDVSPLLDGCVGVGGADDADLVEVDDTVGCDVDVVEAPLSFCTAIK